MLSVVKIKVRQKICASRERIWEIISDVDNDTYFWRGITSIRNLSKNGDLIREVVLGTDNVCTQMITGWPVEKIKTSWIEGAIKGTKEISLISLGRTTLLEIQMNYEFPGVGRSDSKVLAKLFQNEAELAADLIKVVSEGYEYESAPMAGKLWVN